MWFGALGILHFGFENASELRFNESKNFNYANFAKQFDVAATRFEAKTFP